MQWLSKKGLAAIIRTPPLGSSICLYEHCFLNIINVVHREIKCHRISKLMLVGKKNGIQWTMYCNVIFYYYCERVRSPKSCGSFQVTIEYGNQDQISFRSSQ